MELVDELFERFCRGGGSSRVVIAVVVLWGLESVNDAGLPC